MNVSCLGGAKRLPYTYPSSSHIGPFKEKGTIRAASSAEEASHGRRPRGVSPGAVLAFAFLTLIFAGCGISLGAEERESEIFRGLTVEGDLAVGEQLTLALEYEQPYPVAIAVICEVAEGNEEESGPTVQRILPPDLPENPEGDAIGEVTPEAGVMRQLFPAPDSPGSYIIRCFTKADESNDIERVITIAPAAGATEPAP